MHVWIIRRALGTTKSPSYVISNQKCNIPRLVLQLMLPPVPSEIKPVAHSVASIAPNYSFTLFSVLHSGSKTWRPTRDMRTLPWTSMLKISMHESGIPNRLLVMHPWVYLSVFVFVFNLVRTVCVVNFFFLLNGNILMAYVSFNWRRNFCFRGVISYSLSLFSSRYLFRTFPFLYQHWFVLH